jgi:mannose-6-phosphate isomerase-like protein (cupin superfamily)
VLLDLESEKVELNSGIYSMKLPKSGIHGLRCLSNFSYFVLREKNDDIIYLDDIMEKRKITEKIIDPCGIIQELYNTGNLSISYVEVTGTAKRHIHKKMQEIYRVEKGHGQLILGDKTLEIEKGFSIEIPKDVPHYLKKLDSELEVLVITHPKYDPEDFILA